MAVARRKFKQRKQPPSPLRAQRLLRGLAIDEAAAHLGVSKRSLQRWEHDGGIPQSRKAIDRIVAFYGIPFEQLWPPIEDAA